MVFIHITKNKTKQKRLVVDFRKSWSPVTNFSISWIIYNYTNEYELFLVNPILYEIFKKLVTKVGLVISTEI